MNRNNNTSSDSPGEPRINQMLRTAILLMLSLLLLAVSKAASGGILETVVLTASTLLHLYAVATVAWFSEKPTEASLWFWITPVAAVSLMFGLLAFSGEGAFGCCLGGAVVYSFAMFYIRMAGESIDAD